MYHLNPVKDCRYRVLPDMNNFSSSDFPLTEESPKLVLRFLRNSDSNLCEAMVRYAVSQLQISFDEYICVGVLENTYYTKGIV